MLPVATAICVRTVFGNTSGWCDEVCAAMISPRARQVTSPLHVLARRTPSTESMKFSEQPSAALRSLSASDTPGNAAGSREGGRSSHEAFCSWRTAGHHHAA